MNEKVPFGILATLALVIVCGFLAVVTWLIAVPGEVSEAGMLALGALMSAFTAVIGFFFGSSLGSREKDNQRGVLP